MPKRCDSDFVGIEVAAGRMPYLTALAPSSLEGPDETFGE
jgi:hypothetical protein